MKSKRLIAIIMVAIISIFAVMTTASAKSNTLLEDKNVSISVECNKKGFTFEVFKVANLVNSTASPYSTKYESLVSEIASSIKEGDAKKALATLDTIDTLPATATSVGTFNSSEKNDYTFSNLSQGIYYIRCTEYPADVTAVQNSIVTLPYFDNNSWVYEYKKINLAEKVVQNPPTTHKIITNSTKSNENYTDVSLGDNVNFKLTNTVTGSKQIKLTTYTVYDVMSKGLTLNKNSFKVYLADKDNNKISDITSSDYSLNVTKEKAGDVTEFNVALSKTYLSKDNFYNDGVASVIVEYSAQLNKYAVKGSVGNPNEDVKLEYGNTSNTSSVNGNIVEVYTYGVKVQKLNDNNEPLANAKFELYKTETDANDKSNAIASGTSDSNGTVSLVTDNKEEISLMSGKYYICETEAPEGYVLYGKVIPIEIKAEYQDTLVNDTYVKNCPVDGYAECTVTNIKVSLPQTGGYVFYVYLAGVGLILIAGVIFLFLRKKPREAKFKANK